MLSKILLFRRLCPLGIVLIYTWRIIIYIRKIDIPPKMYNTLNVVEGLSVGQILSMRVIVRKEIE